MGYTTQVKAALEAVAKIEREANKFLEWHASSRVHRMRTLAREAIAQLTAIVEPQHAEQAQRWCPWCGATLRMRDVGYCAACSEKPQHAEQKETPPTRASLLSADRKGTPKP